MSFEVEQGCSDSTAAWEASVLVVPPLALTADRKRVVVVVDVCLLLVLFKTEAAADDLVVCQTRLDWCKARRSMTVMVVVQ